MKSLGYARNLNRNKTSFLALVLFFLYISFQSSLQAQYPVRSRQYTMDKKFSRVNDADKKNSRVYTMDKKYLSRDTIFLKNHIVVINTLDQTYRKPVYFSIKSNLLYDAVLLPNLAAEVYLGAKWSLQVNGNWSWWTFDRPERREWFHRIQSVGAELRYWFDSPYPLHGQAVGFYGSTGNYDLRLFPTNESSKGWQSKRSWSVGLSYAYSVPISCYFNMEFGISVGYLGGKYYPYYYCIEDAWWAKQDAKNRHYFGPTQAGVSLVWMIGSGYNRKNRDISFIRFR